MKTDVQLGIEINVTGRRGYNTVPYTNLFGEKRALKQWLRFSNNRVYDKRVTHSEKTSLGRYLLSGAFFKIENSKIIKKISESAIVKTFEVMNDIYFKRGEELKKKIDIVSQMSKDNIIDFTGRHIGENISRMNAR